MGNTFLVLFSSVSVAEPVGLWATPLRCPHVHRLASRLSQPVLAVIDHAEHDRSEEDRMPTVGIVSQTNRLADECRGDVDRVAPPLDLTVLAHPSHLIFSAIFRLTQNAVPTPRRQIVVISWRSIPERFVRSLVIVHLLKGFEALELWRSERAGGLAVSCKSVRCSRSCRPFCCGLPGLIRCGSTSALITFTASFVNPPAPGEANGGPLSERSQFGSPNSRKAAPRIGHT